MVTNPSESHPSSARKTNGRSDVGQQMVLVLVAKQLLLQC